MEKLCLIKTKYILKPWIDKDGYLRVQSVSVGGKRHYIAVHRAVAEVFVPNPNPKEFTIVNHLNGITHDNRPENLEWTNYKHNRAHCVAAGKVKSKGEKHSQAKLTDSDVLRIVSMINLGIRDSDIAENFCVGRHMIGSIRRGDNWSHLTEGLIEHRKRSERFSKSTIEWVKDQIERGRTDAEILSQARTLNQSKLEKIKSLLTECND